VEIRQAVGADRLRLAELAATLQARPERHIVYLGTDPEAIAEEMVADDEDWTAVTAVAEDEGRLVGWLMGSVDAELGRVWWYGPFVDAPSDGVWVATADAMYDHARGLLPAGVDEEEFGIDERFTALARWALARGCHADVGSAVLVLDGDLAPPTIAVRPAEPGDVGSVGRLHDELFARTHTTGSALVLDADDDHVRLVAELDGRVGGYIAVERQAGGVGYIDYLGVAESARRQGLGAELVRAGVAALRELGCHRVSLTVRADNGGARALYVGLGFVEERVIIPFRRGFSLE
jgi:ribosomal protein S18 acetylase RimI-like enzyme